MVHILIHQVTMATTATVIIRYSRTANFTYYQSKECIDKEYSLNKGICEDMVTLTDNRSRIIPTSYPQ